MSILLGNTKYNAIWVESCTLGKITMSIEQSTLTIKDVLTLLNTNTYEPITNSDQRYNVILNEGGFISDADESFSELIGLSECVEDRSLSEIIANRSQDEITSWLKMVRMGSHNTLLIHLLCNELRHVEMSMQGTYLKLTNSYLCSLTVLESYSKFGSKTERKAIEDVADLSEFINRDLFQSLMDEFFNLTGIPIGVIDVNGNVLVAEGWQDICTKFHRINPETCANCQISDNELTKGIRPGEFREYKCKNNMWDVATPIYIGGKIKGHIFLGQFFYDDEEVKHDFFIQQAKIYGFDESEYMKALHKVPRFSREAIKLAMSFYAKLADLISELSYTNAKLSESINVLRDNIAFEQTLMDAIPSPVYYKDLNGKYRGANRAYEEVVGQPSKAFEDKSAYELHPEALAKIYEQADQELYSGSGEQIYESTVTYADGSQHEIMFHKATYSDSIGNIAGTIGVMLDVTSIKKSEKALLKARDELENLVAERTSELLASNQELIALNEELSSALSHIKEVQHQLILSEKMAALGSLVAGISHEVSTPLGVSLTSVSYVEHELKEIDKKYRESAMRKQDLESFVEDSKVMLTRTVNNLKRAHHLLNTFKTIAIDQTQNEWRTFNAKAYVRDLILSLEPVLKSIECTVDFECPQALTIKGYPGAFAQIISNLVNNSVDHAFENKSNGMIKIRLDKQGNENTIHYSDNGSGMFEDVKKRAFEPFFTTTRGSQGGTGLGLHLVYNLVTQKLGGSIELESVLGEGTQFKISFPDIVSDQISN